MMPFGLGLGQFRPVRSPASALRGDRVGGLRAGPGPRVRRV